MSPSKVDHRYKIIGGRKRALSRYAMLKHRTTNTETKKNSCYIGVELRVDKEEFVKWFMQHDFEGCSVDRINKEGHYDLHNMQVVSLAYNIAKDKVKANGAYSECYSCKQTLPLSEFVTESRRLLVGKSTICKPCERVRTRNRNRKSKEP